MSCYLAKLIFKVPIMKNFNYSIHYINDNNKNHNKKTYLQSMHLQLKGQIFKNEMCQKRIYGFVMRETKDFTISI